MTATPAAPRHFVLPPRARRSPRRRDRLWIALLASLLVHAVLLAVYLFWPEQPGLQEAMSPASVEVMVENGIKEGEVLPAPERTREAPAPEAVAPPVPVPLPVPQLAPSAAPAAAPPPPVDAAPPPIPAQVPDAAPTQPPMPVPAPAPVAPPMPAPVLAPAPALEAEILAAPPPPAPIAPPAPTPPPPPVQTPLPPRPQPQPRPVLPRPTAPTPPSPNTGDALSRPLPFSLGGGIPLGVKPKPDETPPPRPATGRGAMDLTLGPGARNSLGALPPALRNSDAALRVEGAQVGADWMTRMHEWWARHGYYPDQAAANGDDGTVQLHMVVTRDGKVRQLEVVGRSGSQWLDMGSLSIFRNATLPPFPAATPENQADIYLTIRYILIRR